uniref:Zinc finger PHD-type domain-containing protein n=1 Tax=Dunaliella tertiolecta TaxID=3047 RepID=A0A7S3QMY0_DUNTE
MSAQKKQKLAKEESPLLSKTIMHRDYRSAPPNTMVLWGVPKSKVKPHIDWAVATTKPTYRMVPVQFKCRRSKSKSTLDVSVVYREDMARDASKMRLGAEDMGFFVVNGLVPRLKESNMLQLGNTAIVFPVEGSPNTFRLEILPSVCPYCDQAMETGEFVECEGCDAHAHRQCVSTIWADDELQKNSSGASAGGASQQPFKFACPACEAREPAVSYSETCTMQTTQNGHHVSGFRSGVNPLKRPLPGTDAPSQPSSLHPHAQAGTSTAGVLSSQAAAAAGAKGDAPQKASSAQRAGGPAGQLPPSPLRSRPSPSPSAAPPPAAGPSAAVHPPGPSSGSGSGSGSAHVAALRALGTSSSGGGGGSSSSNCRSTKP